MSTKESSYLYDSIEKVTGMLPTAFNELDWWFSQSASLRKSIMQDCKQYGFDLVPYLEAKVRECVYQWQDPVVLCNILQEARKDLNCLNIDTFLYMKIAQVTRESGKNNEKAIYSKSFLKHFAVCNDKVLLLEPEKILK